MPGSDFGAAFMLLIILGAVALVIAWILVPVMIMGMRTQLRELAAHHAQSNKCLQVIARHAELTNQLLQAGALSSAPGDDQRPRGSAGT